MGVIADIEGTKFGATKAVIRKYSKGEEKDFVLTLYKRSLMSCVVLLLFTWLAYEYLAPPDKVGENAIFLAALFWILGYLIWSLMGEKAIKKYSISHDIALCISEDVSYTETTTKTSLSKTATKAVLAGAAGSAWKNNKGFLSGLLASTANSISGSSERSKSVEYTEVIVYLMDGNAFQGKTDESTAELLEKYSFFNSQDDYEKFQRMKADAGRVLNEVNVRISSLEEMHKVALDKSQNGRSFDERDSAHKELLKITGLLESDTKLRAHLQEDAAKKSQDKKYKVSRVNKKYYISLTICLLLFLMIFTP